MMIDKKYPHRDSKIEIIPFKEWQVGIAPLWKESYPEMIPIYNDPYGIIEYALTDRPSSIIFLPCAFVEQGKIVAYSSIYNISDSILRIRGIYVLPEYRGNGVAHRMIDQMIALWPPAFYRTVGFWREDSFEKFLAHSGMSVMPGTDWIWSKFSKTRMKLLYRDRWGPPVASLLGCNRLFIEGSLHRYGLGGSNNLAVEWSESEWLSYFAMHQGDYENIDFDLNFPQP